MIERHEKPLAPIIYVLDWMHASSESRECWHAMAAAAVDYAKEAAGEEDYDEEDYDEEWHLPANELARFALAWKAGDILDTAFEGLAPPENPTEDLLQDLAKWALKQVILYEVAGVLLDDLEADRPPPGED